jgi:hypothetical protein
LKRKPAGDGRWSGARGHGDGEAARVREAVRSADEMARRLAMAGGEDLDLGFAKWTAGWGSGGSALRERAVGVWGSGEEGRGKRVEPDCRRDTTNLSKFRQI